MRKLLIAASIAVVAVSCGGRQTVPEVEGGSPEGAPAISLPTPVEAAPAYLVATKRPLTPRGVRKLDHTPGVAVVAPVNVRKVVVKGPEGKRALRVGAIRPLQYRSVAPAPTRDADFVWTSLLSGQAVITFAAAGKLGLSDAGELRLPGAGQVTVGAFADNGIPNVADVLVDSDIGKRAGLTRSQLALIGAARPSDVDELRRRLAKTFPGAHLRRLLPQPISPIAPAPPHATTEAQGSLIGTMPFHVLDNGFIKPDRAWVRANITTASVPILGEVTCHRLMFPQLAAALDEIQRAGLSVLINPADYGGCYVPRFIDRDPSKPLSMHAFGLAIDLNVSTNQLGTSGNMDPRVVSIFQKWGFAWGGQWARPDPMHFELARLVQP